MWRAIAIAFVLIGCASFASDPGKGTPKAAADLRFDASFAQDALAYLRTHDPAALDRLGAAPAAAHLLAHARNFDYDVPKDSPQALVASLLNKDPGGCAQSVAFFTGPMMQDRRWVADALGYLPADFRLHGTLFLTYGYDIGVAFAPDASLTCAHRHFAREPRELLYYAIHELHQVGFMTYRPPLRFSELKTCADLLRAVEYHTQLEGMAVQAAYDRRRREQALDADPDYVALQDEPRMRQAEAQYFAELKYLKRRGNEAADAKAWTVIQRMSGGERRWYRVGARMAQRIESAKGRAALVGLIREGPHEFQKSYREVSSR